MNIGSCQSAFIAIHLLGLATIETTCLKDMHITQISTK